MSMMSIEARRTSFQYSIRDAVDEAPCPQGAGEGHFQYSIRDAFWAPNTSRGIPGTTFNTLLEMRRHSATRRTDC